MLLASQIILIIAGVLLLLDGIFIIAKRPNPLNKDWGFPCPVTLLLLGIGVILFSITTL